MRVECRTQRGGQENGSARSMVCVRRSGMTFQRSPSVRIGHSEVFCVEASFEVSWAVSSADLAKHIVGQSWGGYMHQALRHKLTQSVVEDKATRSEG
jgi:hypothetical protein